MPRSATGAPVPSAYQRALKRLSRRDHSVAELRRALAERGHGQDEIEAAIERLRRERYLDDRGFAERFARSRLAHSGHGRALIRQGLRRRGVGRAESEAGLAGALSEVDEAGVLDSLARRYWRQHARVEPSRRLPRLWAFLVRRGFAASLVRDRLGLLWPRWSDALEGLEPAEPAEADAAHDSGDDRGDEA
jgi:regulatory protein